MGRAPRRRGGHHDPRARLLAGVVERGERGAGDDALAGGARGLRPPLSGAGALAPDPRYGGAPSPPPPPPLGHPPHERPPHPPTARTSAPHHQRPLLSPLLIRRTEDAG